MPHITLVALENCAASSIFGAIDAFAIANQYAGLSKDPQLSSAPFHCDIVTPKGTPVMGEGRVTITPHGSLEQVVSTDFIFLPGFLPPFRFLGNVPRALTNWIHDQYEKGVLIGSTCTGTFLLGEMNMISGKTVTTNLKFSRYFKKLYPDVNLKPERILTEDNGIICSGATSSFFDLCIYLIERFGYPDLAAICSKALMSEPRFSQSPYFIFDYQKDHGDDAVKKAQSVMEEKFTEPISVESLAKSLGISTRHFIRRFKNATGDSPLFYLQRVRVEAAKQKLERTTQSIDEITFQVGYENANSFRKLFKKNTGISPREYRNRFSRLI